MATMTEAIRLVISGDSKGAVKALDDISKKTKETTGVFGKYGKGLNTAANYGSAALVGLVGVITKSVIDYEAYGKAIRDVTRLTDISTESASTLVGEWKRFGVDATAGANGVKFFNKNLDAARQGTKTQVDAFARLGISMEELKTLDDDALLFKTRDALAEMGPGADRTAIALKLMGRGGTALMPWLNIMPKEMAEVNKQLKDAGLIWGDKQLKEYAAAVKAQREMQIALTGISQVIARDVLPALTPLVRGFGAFLRFIRPLAPALVPLTAALAVFVGVVKGAAAVQGAWNTTLGVLPARLTRAKVAQQAMNVATRAGTAVMKASIATLGLYAAAIAAVGIAIYATVKAYQAWKSAANQAKKAADNAQATLDKNAAKLGPAQTAALQAQINASKYQSPQGVLGWAGTIPQAQGNVLGWKSPAGALGKIISALFPGFAAGGDFITRGATPFVAGEAGAERVTITPLTRGRGGGGATHVHLHFHGPVVGGRAGLRELSDIVSSQVMGGVSRHMVGQNG